jgi:hypothetical protein
VKSGVTGLNDADEYYGNFWFAVEPMTGLAMAKVTAIQLNFAIPALQQIYNINSATVPVLW